MDSIGTRPPRRTRPADASRDSLSLGLLADCDNGRVLVVASHSTRDRSRCSRNATPQDTFICGGLVQRNGENSMKILISTLAMAIALAVTGPAFAGPGSTITNKEDCEKAGKVWDEAGKKCVEKQ